jgi:uncharacterized membrane protein
MKHLLSLRLKYLLNLGFGLGFYACSAATEAEHSATDPNASGTCGATNGTYAERAEPFLTQYCSGCHSSSLKAAQRHGAPLDHNFDSEAELRATEPQHLVLQLTPRNGKAPSMPPAGFEAPNPEERERFVQWLQCEGE